jgi:hypothetical protein
VAKDEHHAGELFPRVGFVATTLPVPNRGVVRFYNKRGTAEQWIKEGKEAAHWTRLSCHRFRANEVRLQLSVLAYNLGNLWRRGRAECARRVGSHRPDRHAARESSRHSDAEDVDKVDRRGSTS